MKTLHNFSVEKKNVLLRVDLNVPVKDGIIIDKTRLYSIKSTIDKLIFRKNKIFLLSHFGRPKGKYNSKYSLKFLLDSLKEALSVEQIYFLDSCIGKEVGIQKKLMRPGEICLLENIRFYKEEEQNDINFSKELAKNFDVYINDAFSASHRDHASIVGITAHLPSLAGINIVKEIYYLNKFLSNLKKPATAIIGGSKISTKIKLLNNLVEIFDTIIIGGAMANTFLLSKGFDLGTSLVEKNLVIEAKNILAKSSDYNTEIILPVDLICSKSIENTANVKLVDVKNVPFDQMALDVGTKTVNLIRLAVLKSNMILWNGPLGVYEYKPFNYGTDEIAKIIINETHKSEIITLVGGGDTIAAIKKAKVEKNFTYISTAGGAFLEWLEGNESPGVKALKKNNFS